MYGAQRQGTKASGGSRGEGDLETGGMWQGEAGSPIRSRSSSPHKGVRVGLVSKRKERIPFRTSAGQTYFSTPSQPFDLGSKSEAGLSTALISDTQAWSGLASQGSPVHHGACQGFWEMAEGRGSRAGLGLTAGARGWAPVFWAGPAACPRQSEARCPATTSCLNRA